MLIHSQELNASLAFPTAMLLAMLTGCGPPVSSDAASNGEADGVNDMVVKHAETGISQETLVGSMQNLPARDLLSVLAEAIAVEMSRNNSTTVSSDTPVTTTEAEGGQTGDVINPSQSIRSHDSIGSLEESRELSASMEGEIIVSDVLNEAPPIGP